MTHLWVRAEPRYCERRMGLTSEGAATLIAQGVEVTVEGSVGRVLPLEDHRATGARTAPEESWPDTPREAIVFGLEELPDDGTPLTHRQILFGHAYQGRAEDAGLLQRFRAGGGILYDLEHLVDKDGARVAAFGHWAGDAGAAVSLMAWAAQQCGEICPPVRACADADTLPADLGRTLADATGTFPTALVIGALGRVGLGACDLCVALNVPLTRRDMVKTAHGGPVPEVLPHHLILNCLLAQPVAPVFVSQDTMTARAA